MAPFSSTAIPPAEASAGFAIVASDVAGTSGALSPGLPGPFALLLTRGTAGATVLGYLRISSQQAAARAMAAQTHLWAVARAAAVRAARAATARAALRRALAWAAAERAADARQAQAEQAAQPTATTQPAVQEPPASVASTTTPSGSPQQVAAALLAGYGWAGQFSCLDALWARESGWNVYAQNPSSGAYGIPQALPGSKMASAGADWATDAATQIRWGLSYIKSVYGSPCGAWAHEEATGWY
jgi:hypothetical protein